eukprot:5568408-Pyramimonas_sp.AAC.1
MHQQSRNKSCRNDRTARHRPGLHMERRHKARTKRQAANLGWNLGWNLGLAWGGPGMGGSVRGL